MMKGEEFMLKIKVLSKKETITKDGKEKSFYRYFTPVDIEVIEDGESKGIQRKSLRVHFTKKASKQLKDDKVFAIIGGDIGLPFVYQITEDEDGNKVYPEVWVRDIQLYQEIPLKAKESTCKPVLDEEDTESVEITE